jgi:putative intracellular protease/amidase
MKSRIFNVAVFLYPGADTLDFSGPLDIYAGLPPPTRLPAPFISPPTTNASISATFNTTTFSFQNPLNSNAGGLTYIPDMTMADVSANLNDYDILLIPGADPAAIDSLLETKEGSEVKSLIQKFATLPPRPETETRILQSVCVGAIILAAADVLENRTVTTHHLSFDQLIKHADEAAGGPGKSNVKLVHKRWVDAGTTDERVRIVTAGGVSSGIDATLWILELLAGKEKADWVSEMVEFERRGQDDGSGATPKRVGQ